MGLTEEDKQLIGATINVSWKPERIRYGILVSPSGLAASPTAWSDDQGCIAARLDGIIRSVLTLYPMISSNPEAAVQMMDSLVGFMGSFGHSEGMMQGKQGDPGVLGMRFGYILALCLYTG